MRNAPSRLATQLQQAIRASGLSYYRLAKISGVGHPVISRFMTDKRGINLSTASALADVLGLELHRRRTPRRRRGES